MVIYNSKGEHAPEKVLKLLLQGTYTGYYWKSDAYYPEKVSGSFDKHLEDKNNPFVIEAQLWDEKDKISFSIKYVDGEYYIACYEDVTFQEDELVVYEANNRLKGKDCGNLKFKQEWNPEEDKLCMNGWKVLQPQAMIFVGFSK